MNKFVKIRADIYQEILLEWRSLFNKSQKNFQELSDSAVENCFKKFDTFNGLKFIKREFIEGIKFMTRSDYFDFFEIEEKGKFMFFKIKNSEMLDLEDAFCYLDEV